MPVKVIKLKWEQQFDWNAANRASGSSNVFLCTEWGVEIDRSQNHHKVACDTLMWQYFPYCDNFYSLNSYSLKASIDMSQNCVLYNYLFLSLFKCSNLLVFPKSPSNSVWGLGSRNQPGHSHSQTIHVLQAKQSAYAIEMLPPLCTDDLFNGIQQNKPDGSFLMFLCIETSRAEWDVSILWVSIDSFVNQVRPGLWDFICSCLYHILCNCIARSCSECHRYCLEYSWMVRI